MREVLWAKSGDVESLEITVTWLTSFYCFLKSEFVYKKYTPPNPTNLNGLKLGLFWLPLYPNPAVCIGKPVDRGSRLALTLAASNKACYPNPTIYKQKITLFSSVAQRFYGVNKRCVISNVGGGLGMSVNLGWLYRLTQSRSSLSMSQLDHYWLF